ncbi:response regulator [Glaciecola sp. XM2]|jgi:CheY-like chemotaxis protein|uniref:response regulator n=1 Tax=Glaciecola sp. XM2 TaxID=1914931 RepID=UPI001BDE9154|nr:response regulator [Glaciecola sp. XM2]MBT1452423.1 response regulator [Glaciecola sp. XM2]
MLSILICDDSMVARKQVAKCLPQDFERNIHFAKHGEEALDAICDNKGDLLLLDLNMPVMDGYETLKHIQDQQLNTTTIVISGDIQPEARERVLKLGAVDFIQKPVNADELRALLEKHNMLQKVQESQGPEPEIEEGIRDCYQEVANVAMGQAGAHLAQTMNVFVKLPIPNVNLIEVSELHMMLSDIDTHETTSGVCQGFLGDGISGEALCVLSDSSFTDMAEIMQIKGTIDDQMQLELLMDVASILIGTCLRGIAGQLDMQFRQGHPVVLGQHQSVQELISANKSMWRKTLAIELSYGLENFNVQCDLVLLFTEDSMEMMNAKLAHLLED